MTIQQIAKSMTPIALQGIPDNIKKFLMLVTFTEGTDKDKKPYQCLFTHQYFEGFEKHPNTKIKSGGITSSAAGRYQILFKTYEMLGGGDFSPESQDKLCIRLIKNRNAYNNIVSGDFEIAISKCNKEWASLPGSPYGQPTHKLSECLEFLHSLD